MFFYGNHLPNLNLSSDDLLSDNLYETEYIIWDNINLEKNDLNLEAYQLTSRILIVTVLAIFLLSLYVIWFVCTLA